MRESIEGKLFELKSKLGPSPVSPGFQGLDHVRYRVSAGEGLNLLREVSRRTSYRFAGAYRHRPTGDLYYELRLGTSLPALVIRESQNKFSGFPRLDAMAFKISELEIVRNLLMEERIGFSEEPFGLMTDPLPGLGDRFIYLPASSSIWQRTPDFERIEIESLREITEPFSDVLANIDHLDHIAYRTRLKEVEKAARLIMRLTAYSFDLCYTVTDQHAETMVFRWGAAKPAIVVSYGWDVESVVHNYTAQYGPRVHHTAYYTTNVRAVVARQKQEGLIFTTKELIGDETRGILQIFTAPSAYSHEITEYVERFGSFTGFFDRGNVGELMNSTKRFNR